MRYIFLALFSGFLIGALAPTDPVFGVACDFITNTHSAGETCCGCGNEDHTVDKLKNTGTGTDVCILLINGTNVASINYAPGQCAFLATGVEKDYTVQVTRTIHCNPSTFSTDATDGGGTHCNKTHGHTSFSSCCGP